MFSLLCSPKPQRLTLAGDSCASAVPVAKYFYKENPVYTWQIY